MAKAAKTTSGDFDIDKFSDQMIDQMNDILGKNIVNNLGKNAQPAQISKWYSTKSKLLNWICSGVPNGGLPAGRYSEISGPESIGKSHIAYQVAKWVQDNNGIVNYADTELASSVSNLRALGINTSKRFQYAQPMSIEDTFRTAETFLKLVEGIPPDKRPPLLFVYDSIGGVGSEHEAAMDFADPQRPGANAKQLTFGLRKIRSSVVKNEVAFLIINQVYDIINAGMYEKKTTQKGGRGLRYDCAVRIELSAHGSVYPDEMTRQDAFAKGIEPIGIKVKATVIKNKVAAPFRSVEFEIHFGVGIKEHAQIWEMICKQEGKEVLMGDKIFRVVTDSAWKEFGVYDAKTGEEILNSGKFRKKDLEQKLTVEFAPIIDDVINTIMSKKMDPENKNELAFDPALLDPSNSEDEEDEAYDDLE